MQGRLGDWKRKEKSAYGDSAEGLVDLVAGEALVLEEGAAVDDGFAPDLGVGEELDGVLHVVLPHRLRRLQGQLLRFLAAAAGVCGWCCWSRSELFGQRSIELGDRRGQSEGGRERDGRPGGGGGDGG